MTTIAFLLNPYASILVLVAILVLHFITYRS